MFISDVIVIISYWKEDLLLSSIYDAVSSNIFFVKEEL